MTSPGNTPIPHKYRLLASVLRYCALCMIVLGALIMLVGAFAVISNAIRERPIAPYNSFGTILVSLLVCAFVGGGFCWIGVWIRHGAMYYQYHFDHAVAYLPPVQSPPSSIVAAGDQQIHFSRKWSRWGKDAKQAGWFDRALVICGGLAVAIFLGVGVNQAFHVPADILSWAVPPVCLLPALRLMNERQSRKRRLQNSRFSLAASPDNQFRLRCIGIPEEFDDLGGLANVPFESVIFNCSWTSITLLNPIVKSTAIATATVMGLIAITVATMLQAPLGMRLWIGASTAILAACAVIFLVWQTYVEISPGRLDITWISMFGRGRTTRISADLRSARILVDTLRWQILLEQPESDNPPLFFSTIAIPRRMELAHRILLAAVSTHPSPHDPPPEDE